MTRPDVDKLLQHIDRLEDLLAGIEALAKRKGDPFDLSGWHGDLGERSVRLAGQLESRLTCIVALADVEKVHRYVDGIDR